MVKPNISQDEVAAAAAAFQQHGKKDVAARALGVNPKTFRRHLARAAEQGLLGVDPVLPGFAIKRTSTTSDASGNVKSRSVTQAKAPGEKFALPDGLELKRLSTHVDGEDRITGQWKIAVPGQLTLEEQIARIKRAFVGYRPSTRRTPAPRASSSNYLCLIPCNDWHINLLVWARDAGENWDLKIAERVIGAAIEDAILRSESADTAIVLGGGDLMHADNDKNRTEKSGNVLDADGRHQKGLDVAQRLKVRTIDAALKRHKRVIVRILRGNHDEYSSVAIAYFLLAWYRNEPRVTVDVDASLYFWHRFGSVFIGATHGHTVKLQDMASIMAHRRAEDWGKSKFRYVHGFHVHHTSKFVTEGGGVISESHQAPIPQDAWHYGAGFLSGRSVQTITYHKDFGETGRVRVAILDALPK